jgi:hypothetical protein
LIWAPAPVITAKLTVADLLEPLEVVPVTLTV